MDSLSRSERAFETSCTVRERAFLEKETQVKRERDELDQQRERFSVDVKKMERVRVILKV
jgi:hypothetical protein